MESNDSPEIPDRGETSDIPGLSSGAALNSVMFIRISSGILIRIVNMILVFLLVFFFFFLFFFAYSVFVYLLSSSDDDDDNFDDYICYYVF